MATPSIDDWLNSGSAAPASNTPGAAVAAAPQTASTPTSIDDWLGSATAPPATGAAPVAAPAPQMGQAESFFRALGHHAMAPLNGAAQLVEHGVAGGLNYIAPGSSLANAAQATANSDDAALAQNEANYQKTVPDGVGTAAGAAIGSVAPFVAGPLAEGPALINGAVDASTAALPAAARIAAQAGARLATGAGAGAVSGALNPVTSTDPTQSFAQQKLGQMGAGAVGGALGVPVGGAISRVLNPVGNAAANALQAAGIRPTFGQLLGPTGSQWEQKLTSVPLVGDLINSGRGQAIGDFNRAVANDALSPIGQTVPANVAPGAPMIQHVNSTLSNAYDNIARNGQVVMDQPLQNDIATLQAGIAQDAPSLAGRFGNIVNNQILNKNGGNLTGDQWANSRSMINTAISQHSGPTASSDDAQMVNYLNQLQDSLTANAEHYSNASVQQDLAQANNAYARYKVMEKAAGTVGGQNNGNIFTPAQYLSAARAGQSGLQRATSSGGNAYPATQLAQTAQPLLGNTVPDSGTAGRGLMGALLALHNPLLAAKAAVGAVPYLPGVRNVMPALLTSRPAWMQAAGTAAGRAAPYVGGMLGQAVSGPVSQPNDPYGMGATNAGLLGPSP